MSSPMKTPILPHLMLPQITCFVRIVLGFPVLDTGLSSVPFVQATSFLLTLFVISSIQTILPT